MTYEINFKKWVVKKQQNSLQTLLRMKVDGTTIETSQKHVSGVYQIRYSHISSDMAVLIHSYHENNQLGDGVRVIYKSIVFDFDENFE